MAGVESPVVMDTKLALYPDPADERVTIPLEQPASEVLLVNATGQIVRTERPQAQANLLTIRVADLAAGPYLVIIQGAAGMRRSERLIVRH